MKSKLIILFIAINFCGFAQNPDSTVISINVADAPLIACLSEITQKSNYQLFYNSNWVYNYTKSIKSDSISLSQVLNQALKSTPYGFVFLEPDKIYIINKRGFKYRLPAASNEQNVDTILTNEDNNLKNTEYLKGRRQVGLDTIHIGKSKSFFKPRRVLIEGYLVAEESGEPLIGATFYVVDINRGTASDNRGYLSLELPPAEYLVEIRCLGRESVKYILNIQAAGNFTVKLPKKVNSLTEIIVSGNTDNGLKGEKIGLERISSKKIKELPSLMGEKDVIKVSQLLPGVTSVSEGSSGVNVRGGNADQNLFLINGIPLFNTSHVYGFFSSINQYIIDDFSLFKGYMPIEYSGKLTSVFDIKTRNGNKNRYFAQGGISPVSASLSAEGPIIKDKSSFVLSGRGSYSDWVIKQLKDKEISNSDIDFSDLSASVDWSFNSKTRLKTFVYYSNDKLDINSLSRSKYSNLGASIALHKRLNSKVKTKLVAYSSVYEAHNALNSIEALAYKHQYNIIQNEINGQFNWNVSEKMNIKTGGSGRLYNFDRGVMEPFNSKSNIIANNFGHEKAYETAAFSEVEVDFSDRLTINAGLRYNWYVNFGPNQKYIYAKNTPREPANIIDTINYAENEQLAKYQTPEFRIGINYKSTDFTRLKISFRQTQQNVFLLSNNYSISPVDQWKLADNFIEPAKAKQFSVGFFRDEPAWYSSFSIEAYYRLSSNILEFKDGADFSKTKHVEMGALQGKQEAYGIEVLLSKDKGQFFGWLSYTYSRSYNTVKNTNGLGEINYSETYPSDFDIPHAVNLIANYRINKRFLLSTVINYSTGRPITLPKSVFYMGTNQYISYSKRNEYRLPDYFRVDFSISMEGNLKREKKIHSTWMLNVFNATGRSNPFSVYFLAEEGGFKGYQYSIIGVPVFTVSWNFKLGNYESN